GKSSLLNALVGEERALVAAEPGTTRDYVEARVVWDGVPVMLIDTAGDRAVAGVEGRGVGPGRARAARADRGAVGRDAPSGGAAVGGGRWGGGGGVGFEVWNKTDLAAAPAGALGVSALTGSGLDELRARILERVLGRAGEGDESVIVSTERQRALVAAAAEGA